MVLRPWCSAQFNRRSVACRNCKLVCVWMASVVCQEWGALAIAQLGWSCQSSLGGVWYSQMVGFACEKSRKSWCFVMFERDLSFFCPHAQRGKHLLYFASLHKRSLLRRPSSWTWYSGSTWGCSTVHNEVAKSSWPHPCERWSPRNLGLEMVGLYTVLSPTGTDVRLTHQLDPTWKFDCPPPTAAAADLVAQAAWLSACVWLGGR